MTYEWRMSDWSSDVCSSDLRETVGEADRLAAGRAGGVRQGDDARARLEAAFGVRAVVQHLAAELVTEDHVPTGIGDDGPSGLGVGLGAALHVDVGVQVRPADATGQGAQQHLAGAGADRKSPRLNSSHSCATRM